MGRPASALIVDDEPHVRTFLRLLLREVGITQTWEAPDGAVAVEMVAQHHPGLVLLDINLPVMGGLEALAQIKRTSPDLPVIMVTSQSAITTVHEAVRLGASAYVLKHSPKEQALNTLREALAEMESEEDAD
jgi:two-component system chemotaxis response regulator CheY